MSQNDYGLVSIITPSYNCAQFVAETIEAILAQSYTNWELLITDDCSSDNSCEIIQRYADNDPRIKLLRLEKNSGAGVARNNSISAAKGRFIAFCDSDDRWTSNKLERQLSFMVDNNYGLTYTSYATTDEDGKVIGYVECMTKLNYSRIIRDNGIGCLTAIYDAEKIGKFYMPIIRKRQDWCLWIEIIKSIGAAYGLQEPLAIYRTRNGSISSNKVEMLKYNYAVYHDVLNFSAPVAALLLCGYFLPYYFYKKLKQKFISNKIMPKITPPTFGVIPCLSIYCNQSLAA
jgi:glycosyltransferase involved in cell wall biosynthesis